MASLSDIRKRSKSVEFDGADGPVSITVRALSLAQILDLIEAHAAIAAAFFDKEDRGLAIVGSIIRSGSAAVHQVIDLGLRAEPGTAAAADLDAADQLRLVSAVIDVSMDVDALGKLAAEANPMLKRLGLDGALTAIRREV